MEKQLEEKYKKLIISNFKNYKKGLYTNLINPYTILTKKGVPKNFIADTIVDYALSLKGEDVLDLDEIFFTETINGLLSSDETKNKVITLIKKYRELGEISTHDYIYILLKTDLNLFLTINTSDFFSFDTHDVMDLFTLIKNQYNNNWDTPSVRKFIIYFFSNPPDEFFIRKFKRILTTYFNSFDVVLKKFFIYKTKIIESFDYRELAELINSLDSTNSVDYELAEKMVKDSEILEDDLQNIVNFYRNLSSDFKSILFSDEELFYKTIFTYTVSNRAIDTLVYMLDNDLSAFEVEKFFDYNPNFLSVFGDELTEEMKAALRYTINGVPDSLRNSLELPMTETVEFDGDDIEKMIWDHGDSPAVWVRYYVEDDLWEHMDGWHYDPDVSTIKTYYWDDISETNLNKIKDILKKENPEINLDDEDEIMDAAFENDEIKSTLWSASVDGERIGDGNKLINDIEKVLDNLFGVGNWSREGSTFTNIKTNISLENEDGLDIRNAYYDCGEWNIKCLWFSIKSDYTEERDKPSLPDYRYGVQGDFDKVAFNEYISDGLS
jgi:hypothetical protein